MPYNTVSENGVQNSIWKRSTILYLEMQHNIVFEKCSTIKEYVYTTHPGGQSMHDKMVLFCVALLYVPAGHG
jgi:hypothetical protein